MTREEMIDKMVEDDIVGIQENLMCNKMNFMEDILRGCGWTPYNQLTDDQVSNNYKSRKFDLQERGIISRGI